MTFCKEASQRVDFTLGDVTETSRWTGKPSAAQITCPRCHRTGLRARVVRILPGDHGYAIVPHHFQRPSAG